MQFCYFLCNFLKIFENSPAKVFTPPPEPSSWRRRWDGNDIYQSFLTCSIGPLEGGWGNGNSRNGGLSIGNNYQTVSEFRLHGGMQAAQAAVCRIFLRQSDEEMHNCDGMRYGLVRDEFEFCHLCDQWDYHISFEFFITNLHKMSFLVNDRQRRRRRNNHWKTGTNYRKHKQWFIQPPTPTPKSKVPTRPAKLPQNQPPKFWYVPEVYKMT